MSLRLARKSSDDDPQKKFCSRNQTQGAGQLQRRDFAEFFEKHDPADSTKRRAGPAGAANSAAYEGRTEQCENL
jgi:hypothetical protein